jgi:hypothetical protein
MNPALVTAYFAYEPLESLYIYIYILYPGRWGFERNSHGRDPPPGGSPSLNNKQNRLNGPDRLYLRRVKPVAGIKNIGILLDEKIPPKNTNVFISNGIPGEHGLA